MKLFLLLAASVLALVAPAIGRAQTMKIVIGAAQADNHAPIFAAVEKGFFAAAGLDAKIILYPTGVEMINGQRNGAQQVSVLGTGPFLAGISNGFPLMMIATLHGNALSDSYSDNQAIIASAASGMAQGDLKALAGKKVAVPFGTDAQTYLANLLVQAHVPGTSVHLVNGPPATLATALGNGNVAAVSIWEPWGSTIISHVTGSTRVIEGGCTACFMPGTVLTSRSVVRDDKVLLQRFVLAFARAEQWVRQHDAEAATIDTHWIHGVSAAVLRDSLKHSRFDPRISKLTIVGFEKKSIPQMLAAHELRRSPDVAKAIDPEFILRAEHDAPQYFSDLPPIPANERLAHGRGK